MRGLEGGAMTEIGSALVAVILLDRKSQAERKEGGF